MWLTKDIIYLIPNSFSETLLAFYFSEAMQHYFVLVIHSHSLEEQYPPMELKPYSPCKKHVNRSTTSPIIRGYRTQGLSHLLGRQGKYVWLIVRQLPIKSGWWDAPLALRDSAEVIKTAGIREKSKTWKIVVFEQSWKCWVTRKLNKYQQSFF